MLYYYKYSNKKYIIPVFFTQYDRQLPKKPLADGGSSSESKCAQSPSVCTLKTTSPGTRSSAPRIVTEVGATKKPCQSCTGLIPVRWLIITNITPRWQKKTMLRSSSGFCIASM